MATGTKTKPSKKSTKKTTVKPLDDRVVVPDACYE